MRRPPASIATMLLALAVAGCGEPVVTTFEQSGVSLSTECEEAIGEFLVAIEPIVRGVDFETVSEEEITALGEAMAPAGERFDPDACPDFDREAARAAWLQVAARVAPDTRGYVEYTYPAP